MNKITRSKRSIFDKGVKCHDSGGSEADNSYKDSGAFSGIHSKLWLRGFVFGKKVKTE